MQSLEAVSYTHLDYFVLPSSIHEVLILPDNGMFEVPELNVPSPRPSFSSSPPRQPAALLDPPHPAGPVAGKACATPPPEEGGKTQP